MTPEESRKEVGVLIARYKSLYKAKRTPGKVDAATRDTLVESQFLETYWEIERRIGEQQHAMKVVGKRSFGFIQAFAHRARVMLWKAAVNEI